MINKPKGMTSHDVIYHVRKITGEKKVGHGGTLDPNATGLLIVGVSRNATKMLGEITKNTSKEYIAEITLGEERTTDDSEGKVTNSSNKKIDFDKIKSVLNKFKGKQKQIPPIFSAIKKDGKKAYEMARKGKDVKLEPREIEVFEVELLSYNYPIMEARFKVSSGTYIRSLARDIGRALGTYAYLSNLQRTAIGKFTINQSVKLEGLDTSNWKEYIIESIT